MRIKGVRTLTVGQQGGVGYPPLLVKVGRKWFYIEGSREHGGTTCRRCSEEVGREMKCIAEVVPLLPSKERPSRLGAWEYISWEEFRVMVKEQFGINGEKALTDEEQVIKARLEARLKTKIKNRR